MYMGRIHYVLIKEKGHTPSQVNAILEGELRFIGRGEMVVISKWTQWVGEEDNLYNFLLCY